MCLYFLCSLCGSEKLKSPWLCRTCKDVVHDVSASTTTATDNHAGNKFSPQSKNLPSIIRGIKYSVKTQARKLNLPFEWQERFYEHVIGNKREASTHLGSIVIPLRFA